MRYKKFVVVIIILSFFSFLTPEKAQAQYVDVVQLPKEFALDTIAVIIAKIILKKLTAQTVNWINSGFKGNPGYVSNPSQFFLDIGDSTASVFLSATELNKLCSPFKAQVRLALVKNYIEEDYNFSCTLSTLKNNYDAFTNDFSVGGWDGWFEMTQTSGGNPYSVYLSAQNKLLKDIGEKKEKQEKELSQNSGFLSYKVCPKSKQMTAAQAAQANEDYSWDGYQAGDCLLSTDEETATPGSTINKSLSDALGTGWKQLEAADEINEIITALVTQLIERVVGGIGNGLRGASQPGTGGTPSFTSQLSNDPQPDPVDTGSLTLSPTTMECVTGANGDQSCSITPGTISGPSWVQPVTVQTTTPTPAQCIQANGNYAGTLMEAMQDALNANPTLADSMNTEDNSFAFLAEVASLSPYNGYNITDQVLNGNDNPNRGDLLAIWRSGDTTMERYDVILSTGSGDRTIRSAVVTQFTGSIPLNCTSSGGGSRCRCATVTPPPPTPNPTPTNDPFITSISPVSMMTWNTLTINGTNLTTTVQFIDNNGAKNTEVGLGGGTQTTVLVPRYLKPGNYTVRIYKSATSISNGKPLVIKDKIAPTIPTVPVTSSWTPPQTVNGWWAQVSPDGQYVSYGNWGESWVTNVDTKQTWDFSKPAGLPTGGNARCIAGQWIATSTLTFVCELEDRGVGGFYRYEVQVGEWIARKTNDDPNLVLSSWIVAVDGHWTSYLGGRIAQDNKVVASGVGAAMSVSYDEIVHACDNTNAEICVRNSSGTLLRKYQTRTPNFGTATKNGYIVYGGYGPVHGITPTGIDTDFTVAPWRQEWIGPGGIIRVGNTSWVGTVSWDNYTGNGFVFLRPWGDTRVLAIVGDAVGASVAYRNNEFVIAYFSDVGKMYLVTVPTNSQRQTLN